MKIKIVAEDLKTDELHQLLTEKPETGEFTYEKCPVPDKSKAIDWNELFVIAKEALPYLSLLITSLVAVYTARMKTNSASVKFELSKDKFTMVVPRNMSVKEIEKRLEIAQKLYKDQTAEKIVIYKP